MENGNKSFSVSLWDAHPDSGEDACNTGTELDTLLQVMEFVDSKGKHHGTPYLQQCFTTCPYVEIDGATEAQLQALGLQRVTCNKAVLRAQQEFNRFERQGERLGAAMQAGMAHGCDGYNEAMCWG